MQTHFSMKYKLKKIRHLSGNKATIYSVSIDDNDKTLYELFLAENYSSHLSEIIFINKRLEVIGKKTGARDGFFKLYEGSYGDCVCALDDKKLTQENYLLRDLSKLIDEKLNNEIYFSLDGLEFEGNLELEDDNNL